MAAGIDDYRRRCWDAALHAYGTSYIFQKRAASLKRKTDVLTWVGFAVPLLIGALVGTFGQNKLWSVVLTVGTVIAAVQLVVSLWSLVKRWPEELAYSFSSATANESLASRFAALGEDPPGLQTLRTQLDPSNSASAASSAGRGSRTSSPPFAGRCARPAARTRDARPMPSQRAALAFRPASGPRSPLGGTTVTKQRSAVGSNTLCAPSALRTGVTPGVTL
ncbi:mobilome CxxCx(11)CxxC protein [Streptomyces sp. AC555_RSS877]|uniref:mobilome CxxCx(11)CxxC protein n=1 Tax=Streptomyces sp. AC555_RSS877 TaxID=2823688 RepID=UPI001C25BAEC|nr:mobilome CxxCx(11)CxxC protein [Streptomyces sp. AC555_RSS877]